MNNLKDEPAGLNYLAFLTTPPTSGRTEPSLSQRNMGGCTTRRSLTKPPPQTTFNGIYEGDFTMMTDPMKSPNYKQHQRQHSGGQDSFDLNWTDQNDDHLEDEVDEEIRGQTFEVAYAEKAETIMKPQRSLWDEYKSYIFTKEQYEKIESKVESVMKNPMCRRLTFALRLITVITIWILGMLLRGILLPSFDFVCGTLRGRSILRGSTRRLLWYMTLAKCGDFQLFGLIVILSPLLFLSALMGLLVTSYCEIKNGIIAFVYYVRFRCDVEQLNFD